MEPDRARYVKPIIWKMKDISLNELCIFIDSFTNFLFSI